MALLLPAAALLGLFGIIVVSRERREQGKAPGKIEGWRVPSTAMAHEHLHDALLPLDVGGGNVLWVTPRHPLWCRAVAYHMGLCIQAQKLREALEPALGFRNPPSPFDLGDGGPSSLARAAGVVNSAEVPA
jgi:hypothetical protein